MEVSKNGFGQFKLNKQLWQALDDLQFAQPTDIQKQAIPLIQAGHDVMGIAQTGTGKTAAFVLPLLMKVKYAQGHSPRALILAPTRELVDQIKHHIDQLSKYTDIRSLALYGGVGPSQQIAALQQGVDLLVATPGRFMDLYGRQELTVKEIGTLVLDEADKMMDMGFMPQIRRILEVIPVKRQNLLFSATMPPKVMGLSEEFLEYPQVVEVTPSATTADTVEQYCYETLNFKTKINLLGHLLANTADFTKVIVFARTKKIADNVYKFLTRTAEGEVRVIHSNKAQNTRLNSIKAFKQGDVRILVSTDVSARGIDVSMVSHVINFEVPLVYEDYVHRIGRTGRARNTGTAITFFNKAEEFDIHNIEKLIKSSIPLRALPEEVQTPATSFEEQQQMARIIDRQKKRSDPNYQGAFHEKKNKKSTKKGRSKKRRSSKYSSRK